MNSVISLLSGIGLGAGLMYMLDPDRGRRRQSLLRDQAIHTWRSSGELVDKASRDLQNRATGLAAEARSLVSRENVADVVVAERVRAALGRVVSHPRAISVQVDQGRVTLTGPVLAGEVDRLLSKVASVRGVQGVDNQLQVHQQPGDVPGLQGGADPPGAEFELFQQNWSPGIRLLTILGGGALAGASFMRGGFTRIIGSALGLGLLTRGLTNTPVRRLVGRF